MYPSEDIKTSLHAAIERDSRRNQSVPKIQVRTVEDIRRVLAEFDPTRDRGESVAEVNSDLTSDIDGKTQTIKVSAKSVGKSKRQLVVEAMTRIGESIANSAREVQPVEINGKLVAPARVPASSAPSYIDPMITQWLDAKRDGTIIYWDLSDGYRYKYEPISHKLTRADRPKAV